MKLEIKRNKLCKTTTLIIFFTIIFSSCQRSNEDSIKAYIDGIKVVNTHSHQGDAWMKKYNIFDSGVYLHADLISSGMPEYSDSLKQEHDPESYWDHTEEYLRFNRTTSYYTQFIYNYKELYGLEKPEITKNDFLKFSAEMDKNFKNYDQWIDHVYDKCNIEVIFSDRLWQAFDANFDPEHFRYVFRFDQLVLEVSDAALARRVGNAPALNLIKREEYPLNDLSSYLKYVDSVLAKIIKNGAVTLKMGLAYERSLDFELIKREDAERVFLQKSLSDSDKLLLEDYVVSHIMKKAADFDISVQIHTGYLHGNNGILDNGHPMKLLPLIRSNPNTRIVLFHGGFPWTGDFIVLAKCYPNVFLDIVWLPQLSRTEAQHALHVILDAVPYNKICWGGDTSNMDDAAGSLELGREVVATVLAERIEMAWATREVAEDIADRIFRENAIEIYKLNLSN